ncbi:MAG: tripartite tricarboxylate transporter TctB family protein [Alphaproteobacteria bacterium]|nr:tripartite tricarboxylate transporter TctB family protein [Alphaproteobacteria bacterium]
MSGSSGRPGGGSPSPGAIDRVVAFSALAFSALVYGLTYTFDSVPEALMSGLGAELFPRLVLVVMAILSLLIALGVGVAPLGPMPPLPARVWATGAVLFAFMGAVELIGMFPSSFLLLVGLGRMWGERRLLPLVLSAGALCTAIYLLFVRFVGVSFPRSMLGALWS